MRASARASPLRPCLWYRCTAALVVRLESTMYGVVLVSCITWVSYCLHKLLGTGGTCGIIDERHTQSAKLHLSPIKAKILHNLRRTFLSMFAIASSLPPSAFQSLKLRRSCLLSEVCVPRPRWVERHKRIGSRFTFCRPTGRVIPPLPTHRSIYLTEISYK